ncbi:MAG: site-specific integrase [Patescibacteria group bacterium]
MQIHINDWPAFAQHLVLEQGFEGKKKAMDVYRRRFNKLVLWLGDREFTRKNFVAFIAAQTAKGLKNTYLNNFVKTARQIDKFSGTEEMKGYKELHEQQSAPKDLLTPDEIIKIASARVSYRYDQEYINNRQELLILLLGMTGCRIDEALNLLPNDLHSVPTHVIFRDTKNGDNRCVPISKNLYDKLMALEKKNEYIFSGRRGTKLCQQTINSDLKTRARLCGINKRVYAHLFRHSFCTEMVDLGVNLLALAKITGHHDLQSLMTYYHQSLKEATRVIMMHPLLRPMLSFEQQAEMIRSEVQKTVNRETASLSIEESDHELTIHLKQVVKF